MRMLARFHKDRSICEISHLDTMRAVQRALRRAQIPVQYSQGFHPHINLAFASALGVGLSSEAEWMDVPLDQDMEESIFESLLAAQMPTGMQLCEAHAVDDRYPALMSITAWADYKIQIKVNDERESNIMRQEMEEKTTELLSKPIMTMKKSKKGLQEVDLQPLIAYVDIESVVAIQDSEQWNRLICANIRCVHAPDGALNPLLFLPIWQQQCCLNQEQIQSDVIRTAMWGKKEGEPVPIWTLPKKPIGGQ